MHRLWILVNSLYTHINSLCTHINNLDVSFNTLFTTGFLNIHSLWILGHPERGGGLGSRPTKMYGERLGDGVEYHLMSPTPHRSVPFTTGRRAHSILENGTRPQPPTSPSRNNHRKERHVDERAQTGVNSLCTKCACSKIQSNLQTVHVPKCTDCADCGAFHRLLSTGGACPHNLVRVHTLLCVSTHSRACPQSLVRVHTLSSTLFAQPVKSCVDCLDWISSEIQLTGLVQKSTSEIQSTQSTQEFQLVTGFKTVISCVDCVDWTVSTQS